MALTWQPTSIKDINQGSVANDGTGDSIRNAFFKVDENFSNITSFFNGGGDYATGPAFSTLAITTANIAQGNVGNIVITNINGPYTSAAVNGVNVYGNINVAGNIVPAGPAMYNLGSPDRPFANLYVVATISTTQITTSSDAGLLIVHANTTPTDEKDVGIIGNVSNHFSSNMYAFFGYQALTNNFVYKLTPNNAATLGNSVVYDGAYGNVQFGALYLSNTTPATSNITGALIVAGGIGTNQDIHSAGNIYQRGYRVLNTADVDSLGYPVYNGTGAAILGNLVVATTTPSASTNTGALVVLGGVGVAGNITAGGYVGNFWGNVTNPVQPFITTVGSLGNLTVLGTTSTSSLQATSGSITGLLATTGIFQTQTTTLLLTAATINAGTIGNTGANIVGTVGTAAQPTITTVGNLTNLSVAGNLTVVGSTSLVGNVTFPNITVTTTAVVGKLNSAGNIHVTGGNLTVSTDATAVAFVASGGLTNSLLTISKSANSFVQSALTNRSSGTSASSDFIAYADNGTNIQGYIDMGIANSGFNDPTFGITKAGDGYIFVSAPPGTGGNLVLATADGSQNDIVFAAGGFFDGTEQGRFVTGDGLYLTGNLVASLGTIYQGEGAKTLEIDDYFSPGYAGLTNASGIFVGNTNSFVQLAMRNHDTGSSASTDLIAYSSNGDNDSGWIDMGITSENFADATFGVTGPADGYIFMSAPVGTTGNGSMYLSTSGNGSKNDIVFSTDGFTAGNERMRIVGIDRPGRPAGVEIYIPTTSVNTTTGALRVQGGVGIQGNLNVAGNVSIIGNLTFGGNGTSVSTSTLTVESPITFVANANNANTFDIGLLGQYKIGANVFTGLIRQATTGGWRLVDGISTRPTNTITWSGATNGNLMVGSALVANSTASTSTTTGALQVVGGVGVGGTIYVGGNIIPGANLTSNIGSSTTWFNTFFGVSTQAKYADLAERYASDAPYDPGTVVIFGGLAEITTTNTFADVSVAGAISTEPAYLMNAMEEGLPVALRGRIPLKVIGPVAKGDLLVTAGQNPGYATSVGRSTDYPLAVFAKSLENNQEPGVKIITAVIL
jgi:hypothetical protein